MTLDGTPFEPVTWRELVAVGVVANDLSATTIARCVGVSLATAQESLALARAEGILQGDRVDASEAVRLVGELSPSVVAGVHAAVARFLLSEGPDRLLEAIEHARSADSLSPTTELVAIADRAARTCLSVGDYLSALRLLEFAHEFGTADPIGVRADRLRHLASALDGLGLVAEARHHLGAAFGLAELDRNAELAVTTAVEYALPVDWYAGDRRATAQLERAEALIDTEEHRVMLHAARAMTEMRIPVTEVDGQQVAWVTRPSIAQPLAEDALARSAGCTPRARMLALLSWRNTHRSPEHLETRRRLSSEAFDLAQQLRTPGRQVDAAVYLAVDALESVDRPGFDQALTVLRWVAETDGNPRLSWLARALAAGAAHLDGDVEAAEVHRSAAGELGRSVGTPGWLGADLLLLGQTLLARSDHGEIARSLPDEAGTELLNPLGKLIVGVGHATLGSMDRAEGLLRRALRQFDREASWLLCLTRAADLVLHLEHEELLFHVRSELEPWHQHVAVDSQGWFCDGPVSGWLALLAREQGDVDSARRHLIHAESAARSLGDVRSLARLAPLMSELGGTNPVPGRERVHLDDREIRILQLVVDGWSNPQIADALAFSRSTIRNELTNIYRKLGVATRSEAAALAVQGGLCSPLAVPAPSPDPHQR